MRIASIKETTRILEKYDLVAKKSLGQNFLIDYHIIEKIVNAADLTKETCVIEIGPGIGALTQGLVENAGYVLAYDIDQRLKPVLQESLANYDNIDIVFQDFMRVDLEKIVASLLDAYKEVVIVTNLPYYITTPIIEKIIMSEAKISRVIMMMQKEVAEKLAKPKVAKDKLPLNIMMEVIGEVNYLFQVPKQVFMPKPSIESAVLEFKLLNSLDINIKDFYELINIGFKQRRKTLYNNLKKGYPEKDIITILEQVNIDRALRCEQLDITQWHQLYKVIYE